MDIRQLILKMLRQRGSIRVADVTKVTGFSRAYINRHLQELRREGKLVLLGKANKARYVAATRRVVQRSKQEVREVNRILRNKDLSEDLVLDQIKREAGVFFRLPDNVSHIVDYAFTEMLNNAIEHSRSEKITVRMRRSGDGLDFKVVDRGIGIFKNIMATRGLENELAAIQDLLKGKQTTDPERHTGEGIFFTSKVAGRLVIKGSGKKLVFDNILEDVFVLDIKPIRGTEVEFWISQRSKTQLPKVFRAYAGDALEFAKTVVAVELYKTEGSHVSRSEARRLLAGLEKFKQVTLDFKNVETVGQSFADEVFRVWQRHHPDAHIRVRNANENVQLMIQRASGS